MTPNKVAHVWAKVLEILLSVLCKNFLLVFIQLSS